MKKLLKIVGILIGLFVLLLIGAVVALKVMFPPEKVRALVEAEASKVAKRDIQIKGASLSLYPVLGLQIEGIRVSNTIRSNTIEKDTTLWDFLKTQNLDKRFVLVKVNEKPLEMVFRNNVDLKKGDKLRISRKDFNEKEPLFALDKLFVGVQLMPLLQQKIRIRKILLDKLQLTVEVDRRGSFNFDDLSAPPKAEKKDETKTPKTPKKKPAPKETKEEAAPLQLSLESFEIKNARIVYRNLKTRQTIILGDINQTLSASFDSSMTDVVSKGLFEIRKMTVRGAGMPVRKSGMYFMMKHNVQVNVKKGNLKINQFTVGLQKTAITTTGVVNGYDKKARYLNLAIKTNTLRLQDLFREVPPAMFPLARKMSVKGNAKLGITIKGTLDARKPGVLPAIKGAFKLTGGMFKYADLPKAINDMNIDMNFTQDSLDLKKFAMKFGQDPILMRAKVNNFKQPVVDADIKANVDLGGLKGAVKLPEGVAVSGKVKADVSAKGQVDPKNPDAIKVKGQIEFVKIVAKTPALPKPANVDGTFKFSNEAISVEKMVTKMGRTQLTVDMKITDYMGMVLPKKAQKKPTTITYSMVSPLIDANELLGGGPSSAGGKGKSAPAQKAPAKSGGGGSSTGNEPIVIPKLPNVVFSGKIRVAKLLYKTLPVENGAIDLGYKNKVMTFSMGAKLFEGKIKESVTLNLSNPNRISAVNKFSCVRIEANDFISNFNDIPTDDGGLFQRLKGMDNTVYGKMDLVTSLRTSGITQNELQKNLSGTIVAKLYRGKIKNATILSNMTKTVPDVIKKYIPKLDNISTRKTMKAEMVIKDGKVKISKIDIPMRRIGLAGYGSIGLDSKMDLKMDLTLSRYISRKILRQQKRLQKAAGGAIGKLTGRLGGKLGGAVKGQLGKLSGKLRLIPSDKKGRVTPIFAALGAASNPKYTFVGFKGAVEESGDDKGSGGSITDDAKKMLKGQLDNAKKRAMAAAKKAKQQAMKKAKALKAQAQKRVKAAKAKALAAAGAAKAKALKAANDAKAKAQKQAKLVKQKAAKKRKAAQARARKLKQKAAKKKKALEEKAKKGVGNALKKW